MIKNLNRLANTQNAYQMGDQYKKVLCVCSAGLLRSPTAAVVLSQPPFNFNTRAVGISQEYALIPIEDYHLAWADEVVVMQDEHAVNVDYLLTQANLKKPVIKLNIEDNYPYRHPDLMRMIHEKYVEATGYGK